MTDEDGDRFSRPAGKEAAMGKRGSVSREGVIQAEGSLDTTGRCKIRVRRCLSVKAGAVDGGVSQMQVGWAEKGAQLRIGKLVACAGKLRSLMIA